MTPLYGYLIITTLLFGISLAGLVVHRKNVILLLVCIELMFGCQSIDIFVSITILQGNYGMLTVAAAEAAIKLAIVMLLIEIVDR